MNIDVPAALRDLEKVADRIAAMLEWQKLAQQERGSRSLPPFVLSQKNWQEFSELQAQFSFLCMSLHMTLEDPELTCSGRQRETWREALHKLEKWVYSLGRDDRFIKG